MHHLELYIALVQNIFQGNVYVTRYLTVAELLGHIVYTECLILIFASKYLVKYKRYGKIFSIKVLLLREGHKMVSLV